MSSTKTAMAVETATTSDFQTAMPVASFNLEQLGIEEGKPALELTKPMCIAKNVREVNFSHLLTRLEVCLFLS
jgi:hypothetical protein